MNERELRELADTLEDLKTLQGHIEELLSLMSDIECDLPNDIVGSHHADMEWNATLSVIQERIQSIEDLEVNG